MHRGKVIWHCLNLFFLHVIRSFSWRRCSSIADRTTTKVAPCPPEGHVPLPWKCRGRHSPRAGGAKQLWKPARPYTARLFIREPQIGATARPPDSRIRNRPHSPTTHVLLALPVSHPTICASAPIPSTHLHVQRSVGSRIHPLEHLWRWGRGLFLGVFGGCFSVQRCLEGNFGVGQFRFSKKLISKHANTF